MKARDPAWLAVARAQIGTREIPGPTHNSKLIDFLNTAARWNGIRWKDDEMPWCGGFVAACLVAAGIDPVKLAARAKSWAAWGTNLRTTHLAPGAILVFGRQGGGHVGFYIGETARSYRVLGGNQGDRVSETWIAKERCIAIRWPEGQPVTGAPVFLAARAGERQSTNEA